METIARTLPRSTEELAQIPGLKNWQIGEMGEQFIAALSGFKAAKKDSPYLEP